MIQETIIKYLVIVAIVASITAYATHKITVNAYAADALKVQNAQITKKETIDNKIAVVEQKGTEIAKAQETVKEVVRIKYIDVIKTNTVYVDKACTIPVDGVQLLDETALKLNATRK